MKLPQAARPQTAVAAQREASHNHLGQVFSNIADAERRIDAAGLQAALEIKNDYFAQRIFAIFDQAGQGYLTEEAFIKAIDKLVHGSDDDKLEFAFRLHDADGDGALSKDDITQFLKASRAENRLSFRSDQVEQLLVELLFKQKRKADDKVPFQAFKRILRAHPGIDEQLTLSAVAWLQPQRATRGGKSIDFSAMLKNGRRYVDNNRTKLLFLLIYMGVNAALFAGAFIHYGNKGANFYVQIARGCGACLNFNGALILVPMLRHTLTWLRRTDVRHFVPLDQNIAFHKLVGLTMFALSIVHTVAHLFNYSTLPTSLVHNLFLTRAGLTGVLLLLIFAAMGYCESKRGKHFELFYFSHLAFIAWFILALIHGPVFWKWALLPIIAYCIERWVRFHATKTPSMIENVVLFPSRVTNLQIARPAGFDYRPGDYVFIKIPVISRFEWHPFTISSGPEDPHTIGVHIRNSGNWTNTLYEYFTRHPMQSDGAKIPIYLDGPYGAPSSQSLDSKIAVLIGAGIGVTPCASILQSILHQHQSKSGRGGALKRVHFFWLNRDQQSFEWFVELLRELESQDIEDFLDINIYMTGAKPDMKNSTLNIAMGLLHRRLKLDLLTGLQARTNMGHPKWEKIFEELAQRYRGHTVDVYFCGPPGLSATLKRHAHQVGFKYHKENF
ncbi:MAG: ferric reductase-like transmembrane domain-containing protein [Burkholderiales bacterium]|nr:ferric reductase-like transmembrane domain-containing protein [Burkholderiales bacterium]